MYNATFLIKEYFSKRLSQTTFILVDSLEIDW
jgi:hypothetical protein